MESLESPKSYVLTKISNFSNIMVYYGYINEWAEFFRLLWKKSKKAWDENEDAIIKVIMDKSASRFRLSIKKPFNATHVKYLLAHRHYTFYTLNIQLAEAASYKAWIKFIESLPEGFTNVFNEISMISQKHVFPIIKKFMESYISHGYDLSIITASYKGFYISMGPHNMDNIGATEYLKVPFASKYKTFGTPKVEGVRHQPVAGSKGYVDNWYELVLYSNQPGYKYEYDFISELNFTKLSIDLEYIESLVEYEKHEILSENWSILLFDNHSDAKSFDADYPLRTHFNKLLKLLPNVHTLIVYNYFYSFVQLLSFFVPSPVTDEEEKSWASFEKITSFEFNWEEGQDDCIDTSLKLTNTVVYLMVNSDLLERKYEDGTNSKLFKNGQTTLTVKINKRTKETDFVFYPYVYEIRTIWVFVDEIVITNWSDWIVKYKNLMWFDPINLRWKLKNPRAIDPSTLEYTSDVYSFADFINCYPQEWTDLSYLISDDNLWSNWLIVPCQKSILKPHSEGDRFEIYPEIYLTKFINWRKNLTMTIYNDLTQIRDSYSITIQHDIHYNDFQQHIKEIPRNSIVSITLSDTFAFGESFTNEFIETLFELNLIELRIDPLLSNESLTKMLASQLEKYDKLRDLELNLQSEEQVLIIFKSIQHNYMIKTVRIHSRKEVSDDIIQLADEFRSKRIAVEIWLNTKHKRYKASTKKNCETFYPN